MFPRRRALAAVLAVGAVLGPAGGALGQGAKIPVVVELFTSQGCSSCPPADRVLDDLADRAGLLALTLPITYWDHLGWKDTLASPANTARQRRYAEILGLKSVYTPQMIVGGTRELVGSRRSEAESAIAAARDALAPAPSLAVRREGSALAIAIGEAPKTRSRSPTSATVWVMPYRSHAEVKVARGENGGSKLAYTHAVANVVEAGRWDGLAVSLSVPLATLGAQDCDAVAVLVQTDRLGPILAAGMAALR
ncbi:MAG: DUF1223 domain-containing protein [Alphaproteobacteria bacterium]|nr:DUF1223 domain-containing protein [Alphaproteobacteria bacterium]